MIKCEAIIKENLKNFDFLNERWNLDKNHAGINNQIVYTRRDK